MAVFFFQRAREAEGGGGRRRAASPRAKQCGEQLKSIPYLLDALVQSSAGALPVVRGEAVTCCRRLCSSRALRRAAVCVLLLAVCGGGAGADR